MPTSLRWDVSLVKKAIVFLTAEAGCYAYDAIPD